MTEKTKTGPESIHNLDSIPIDDIGRLYKGATDSFRGTVSGYATRHGRKLICRSERKNGKRIGIRVFRTK